MTPQGQTDTQGQAVDTDGVKAHHPMATSTGSQKIRWPRKSPACSESGEGEQLRHSTRSRALTAAPRSGHILEWEGWGRRSRRFRGRSHQDGSKEGACVSLRHPSEALGARREKRPLDMAVTGSQGRQQCPPPAPPGSVLLPGQGAARAGPGPPLCFLDALSAVLSLRC